MRIVVHIGELALHGFAAGERHAIGDAVQRSLAKLLRATPSARLAGLRAADALAAPDARRHAHADGTGQAIAAAVHGALTQSGR